MQRIRATVRPGHMQTRVVGILLAGLFQAGFIWALVAGLDIRDLVKPFTGPIETYFPETKIKPPPPPPPVKDTMPEQAKPVPLPPIVFETEPSEGGITLPPPPTGIQIARPGDHGPLTVAGTHTIPPYPAMDIRLGNQGTVLLRLLVGTDGRVLDAKVVRTSGYDSLDRAAQAWVLAHWRYQAAIRGGVAVQGAVDVAVKFDLKNAG